MIVYARSFIAFVLLSIAAVPTDIQPIKPDLGVVRRRQPLEVGNLWQEARDSAPCFTFLLRPRVIQIGGSVKLLCCLSGKPTPEVSPMHNAGSRF